ncbi:hypothetical protein BE20_35255 [Sorangium cellulosum]|uniref:Cytochrome c domain-containing protein n=1 Tax=Sorangium cellulosum TaxID=56 RepID=A0A150RYP0_SORCE|nr:hypothetical protein BE18_45175 [Sorangium cellulosum]KYF98387.1 hypothetical protein BE20_35255 [Sorangium cellulosum]
MHASRLRVALTLAALAPVAAGCAEGSTLDPASPGGPPADPAGVFPAAPVLLPGAPGSAPDLFGPPDSGLPDGGPCLLSPEPGALVPLDWAPLEIELVAPASQDLFEIRLHAEAAANELVLYTPSRRPRVPRDVWTRMTAMLRDHPVVVSVRGATLDGEHLAGPPARGSTATFTIAPVEAGGRILFTSSDPDRQNAAIHGVAVASGGIPSVELIPGSERGGATSPAIRCIGCHEVTPDGRGIGAMVVRYAIPPGDASFAAPDEPWRNEILALPSTSSGEPGGSFPSLPGASIVTRLAGDFLAFSPAHWAGGDRVAIGVIGAGVDTNDRALRQLAWFNLDAVSRSPGIAYEPLARTGDPAPAAVMPAFSHDGARVVYASWRDDPESDVEQVVHTDLYSIPYRDPRSPRAMPVPGAAEPAFNEYYPAFSPDDELIAFTRTASPRSTHSPPDAEIYVIPAGGGAPVRLSANDPPACSGCLSPGVRNSWARFAKEARRHQGKTYYWIVFSSGRRGHPNHDPFQQIYVTGLVVRDGGLSLHGALRLPGQPDEARNIMPSWDQLAELLPEDVELR